MRTISADYDAILLAGARAAAVRMSVADAGNTLRDLSVYPGVDLFEELSWGESLDSEGYAWSASLTREQRQISAAPYVTNSPLNRDFDPTNSYAPLLQIGRKMKVEYSMQAYGDPRARTWVTAFEGYIDTVDSASGDTIKLTGRGLEAVIMNAFMERERVYAFAQGTYATQGAYLWPDPTKGTAYTTFKVGDLGLPTDAKTNGHFYRVGSITTGIVGATEPAWPTSSGATVVDGGVTWVESGATSTSVGTPVETVMQQILNDNLGAGAVTLWTPASPLWDVVWFLVSRQSVFAELKALADEIGWCLRYSDHAGTQDLKFFDPNRTTTTSLRTFDPGQYEDPTKLALDWKLIRNAGRGVFGDSQDLDPAGNPLRKAVTHEDATSISKYGRLFFELSEDSTSNIDTVSEADDLVLRVLSDLSEPTADMTIPLSLFFFAVELCDLYTFTADDVRFDVDQKLAVSSYSHEYSSGSVSTSLDVRGKPASNSAAGWSSRFSDAQGAESHQLTTLQNVDPFVMTMDTSPVGGVRLGFGWKGPRSRKDVHYELHLSKTPNFTASAATLVQTGQDRVQEVANLDPSMVYSGQLIPVILNAAKPVRGSPSAEFTFQPGRAQATHLNPNVDWSRFPLNGGFETQFDLTTLPDFWFIPSPGSTYGVFNTNQFFMTDANGISGGGYMKLLSTSGSIQPAIYSAEFPVDPQKWYAPSCFRKNVHDVGGYNVLMGIAWYDVNHNHLTSSGDSGESWLLNDQTGVWVKQRTAAFQSLYSTARFARVFIILGAANTNEVHVDDIRLDEDERWHDVGDSGEPPFIGSWVNAGAPYAPVRFMRTVQGRIRLSGRATSWTGAMFTLPTGYLPDATLTFAVTSNGAHGEITVDSFGVVTMTVGNMTYVSLDGLEFDAAP